MTSTKKKKAPPWRRGFLRALRRTGNVRVAARQAGVDHGAAYQERRRDGRFAAGWERALAGWREGLEKRPRRSSPRARGGCAGEDLVVRRSVRGGTQLVRVGAGRWSAKAEEAFFASLVATANVRRAAATAGFSTTAIYNRRIASEAFRARWEAALEQGRAALHMMLIAAAHAALGGEAEAVDEGDSRKVSVAEAIAILRLERTASAGGGRRGREAEREPDMEAVRDEVLRRLAALRRQREA